MVTGAGSGIGRAIAVALSQRRLRVLLVGRDRAKLQATAKICSPGTEQVVADIADTAGRAAAASRAGEALHVLVHAAGAWASAPLEDLSPAAWSALDAANLHGPILLTTRCLGALQAAHGYVAFINSTAALQSGPNTLAYAAGKAALRAAASALRQEANARSVRVLSVFPGRTDTPMQGAVLATEGRSAPPGTLMQPEDVAAMVLAALMLPKSVEVTELIMRPTHKF
jgi:NADP-dependent 3-hydroxy acid dehydrogenase YdfG